ncbi:MAG: hypothetical protein JWL82_274 [Parcubacteria group bacterium]|nr:hypothetical protein [Parcubacteria group bacterium]
MPRAPKAKLPTSHFELGADGTNAFFVFTNTVINRIEIVSISLKYVIFRVCYPDRSFLFGFRFGKPFIRSVRLENKIRLAAETYRELYRLADSFMHASLAGVQENFEVKHKGYYRLNDGERFKIRSIRAREFIVECDKLLYVFEPFYSGDEVQSSLRGTGDGLPKALRTFLFGFSRIAMTAYTPYKRVEGELLQPLALYPDHEAEAPRKTRQMRTRKKLEALKAMGKPAKSVPKKEPAPPLTRNLFEARVLR